MTIYLPSTFILRYIKVKMIVHAIMINLINRAIDIQEKWKPVKIYV